MTPPPGPTERRGGPRIWLTGLLLAWTATHTVLAQEWVHRVRPGDNLWNLSQQYLQRGVADVRRLQDYNNIARPNRIPPGTTLRIPVAWLKAQPAPARVIEVKGGVLRHAGDGGVAEPAVIDSLIRTGDRLSTAADGSALVEFADGSRLRVHAETELVFDELSAFAATGMVDTRIRLRGGRTENTVKPGGERPTRYEISTPPAVAAVRGTEFRVAYEPADNTTRSEVTEGSIAVSSGGEVREVPAGFGLVAELGRPLPQPRSLLPAPRLEGLPALVERAPLRLAWPPVEGATAYRVQLFAEPPAARLVADLRLEQAGFERALPPDGDYRLDIRGIDDRGLEGLSAAAGLRVERLPAAPLMTANGELQTVVTGQVLNLDWNDSPDATSYRWQIADNPGFDPILEQGQVAGSNLSPAPRLAPGDYYWRVAGIDERGRTGSYSTGAGLRVLAVPPAPMLDRPRQREQELELVWSESPLDAAYQIEIARDAGFTERVLDARSETQRLTVPGLAPGNYLVRVRATSTDGITGPYSTPHEFQIKARSTWWVGHLLLLMIWFAL